MRLDKYLCELNIGTRSQVKKEIKAGCVTVNQSVVQSPDYQVNENTDEVLYQGKALCYQKFRYYMLNKPAGVVSATTDSKEKTVLDLLPKELQKDLFPAGRLDKDTEGFLLLTNDGALAHELLSPKKHVDKTYLVTMKHALSNEDIANLTEGVDIGEKKITKPARVNILDDTHIFLTIQEGKYHQIKRMLVAVSNEVLALKRVSFGPLALDETLEPGSFRELTAREVELLTKAK